MKTLNIETFVRQAKDTTNIKSVLKDLFDMNIKKVKVLMHLVRHAQDEPVKVRPLRRTEGWNDSQTTQILTQLQKQGWISKHRNKEDERQIIITANQEQHQQITALLNKMNTYIETHTYAEQTFSYGIHEALAQFIREMDTLSTIEHYAKQHTYTLDEVVILAMLLLDEGSQLTVKKLKVDLESNTVKINKLVKRLVAKGLISKARDVQDERVVVLTLNKDKREAIEQMITQLLAYVS